MKIPQLQVWHKYCYSLHLHQTSLYIQATEETR